MKDDDPDGPRPLCVDLHRHLEGSIRPATAVALGRARGVFDADTSVASFEARAVIRAPCDLLDALERFDLFRAPLFGFEAIVRIAREAIEDAAAEGVTHLDLRFSPVTLAAATGVELADTFRAVDEGVHTAAAAGAAPAVEQVLVVSRRRGVAAAWQLVRALEAGARATIAGVDLASDELRLRTAAFAPVADALAGLGLPLTVHTGEGVGPDAVAEALALPGVERLGHALSLVDDPSLVAEVIDRGIVVEVCPTSNVRTRTARDLATHPARALRAAGVRVAICTDDPSLFGIDLAHELDVAATAWGWSRDALAQTQRWARAAFFDGGRTAATSEPPPRRAG